MSSLSFPATTAFNAAVLLPPTPEGFAEAGKRLRAGTLVAFPTETVYGLGANAFDEAAVRSIFTTKGRPLTDPLIVHVPTQKEALQLLQLEPEAAIVYELLATTFWPGPLTLVGKAVDKIPLTVTAGTGFVGIRCPNHALAQSLLVAAQVPVAAPSANRFGHVSPTTAQHVFNDLGTHDIAIVNGEHVDATVPQQYDTCNVGIESTVAKVDSATKTIIIYRRGGISEAAIKNCLAHTEYTVQALNKQVPHDPSQIPVDDVAAVADQDTKVPDTKVEHVVANTGEQAPGQCLTHYAPDVATSLLCHFGTTGTAMATNVHESCTTPLNECIVIDFGGHLRELQKHVLEYRDLSTSSNVSEAAHRLFDTLRWTEHVEGAKQVLLVDICEVEQTSAPNVVQHQEHLSAVADRMFRAASGHRVYVDSSSL